MCDIIIHDARNNPKPVVSPIDPLMKMVKRVSEVATNLAYMDDQSRRIGPAALV